MPIPQPNKKPIGLSYPLSNGNQGYFAQTYTPEERLMVNVRNLLLTTRGERWHSTLGTNLRRLIFDQMDEETWRDEIELDIKNSLREWMPFVVVKSFDILFNESGNSAKIKLTVAEDETFTGDTLVEIVIFSEEG